MDIDHGVVVAFAKSFGLFYLIALSVVVLIYTFWPSNRRPFDEAAQAVIDAEDTPWQ